MRMIVRAMKRHTYVAVTGSRTTVHSSVISYETFSWISVA